MKWKELSFSLLFYLLCSALVFITATASNNNAEASLKQSKACQSTTARRASMKVADEENGRERENCMRINFTPNAI